MAILKTPSCIKEGKREGVKERRIGRYGIVCIGHIHKIGCKHFHIFSEVLDWILAEFYHLSVFPSYSKNENLSLGMMMILVLSHFHYLRPMN